MKLDDLLEAARRTVDAADEVLASPLSSVARNTLSQARASLHAALHELGRARVSPRSGRVFCEPDPKRWYFTSEELARAAAGAPTLKITGRYFIGAVLPELTISDLYPWVGKRLRIMRDTSRRRVERIDAARELIEIGGFDRWPEVSRELRREVQDAERGEFWAHFDIVAGEEPDPAETGVEFVVR